MSTPPSIAPTPLEDRLWIPNWGLIFIALLLIAIPVVGHGKVSRLVRTTEARQARIVQLESWLHHGRISWTSNELFELARLYARAGEFPWAWALVARAEEEGWQEPGWLTELGIAYLQIGAADHALRVFSRVAQQCRGGLCRPDQQARMQVFRRVARQLKNRNIDSLRYPEAANRILRRIFKRVKIDRFAPKEDSS